MASIHFRRYLNVPLSGSSVTETLLLEVTHSDFIPPVDLDGVTFTASNDESLFKAHLRASQVKKARMPMAECSPESWISMLRHLLIGPSPDPDVKTTDEGFDKYPPGSIELVAAIEGNTVEIHVRQSISGIKQRLGLFTLSMEQPPEDFSFFNWCTAAVAISTDEKSTIASLKSQLLITDKHAHVLQGQIDDFIQAREEHDEILFSKFAVLLNAKKAEIRRLITILRDAGMAHDPFSEEDESATPGETKDEDMTESERDLPSIAGAGAPATKTKASRRKVARNPTTRAGKRKKSEESDDDDEVQIKSEKASDDEGNKGELEGMETDREVTEDEGVDSDIIEETPRISRRSPPPTRQLPFRVDPQDTSGVEGQPAPRSRTNFTRKPAQLSGSDESDDEL